MRTTTARSLIRLLIVLGYLLPMAAQAQWNWSAGVGASHNNNEFKTAEDEVSDTKGDVALAIRGEQTGPKLDTSLALDMSYGVHRLESATELAGGVNGSLLYRLSPRYLHFEADNSFGQYRRDLLLPDSRDNRSNFNVFTAGPDVILPFGKRSSLRISGRWSDRHFQDSLADSSRLSVSSALAYELSANSSLSLTASNADVSYQLLDDIYDYTIQEGALNYWYRATQTTINLEGGQTRIKYRDRELPTQPLFRAFISRNITNRSMLTLSMGSTYSDNGDRFVLDQSVLGVDQSTLVGSAGVEVFKSDYAYLAFRGEGARITTGVSVGWARSRHDQETELDSESRQIGFSLTRRSSARTSVFIRGDYAQQVLESPVAKPDDWTAAVGLDWRFRQSLAVVATVEHFAGTRGLDNAQYKGDSIGIRFTYSPIR